MKSAFVILLVSLTTMVNGQQSSPARSLNPVAEDRVQEILKTLESDNNLRLSLERGDGVRHAWMDGMRQYGIKQASFVISFSWNGEIESLKIKKISFLRQYYRNDTRIRDRNLLRRVRDTGLERELSDAILNRARAVVPQIIKKTNQGRARGTFYLNLLDDEALPVLDEMPDVGW